MKILFVLLASMISTFVSSQDFPLTFSGNRGTQVQLALQGNELTIDMTYPDYPGVSAKYLVDICDINYIGGDIASYDYSYTKYYFLKVSFALKKNGRYKVLKAPSVPYYAERPYDYANEVDGNQVTVGTNCIEFDQLWNEVNDPSCNTIFVTLQAFEQDVNFLYEWKQRLLTRIRSCDSERVVYQKHCFSCRYEKLVSQNNPSFRPHLDDCEPEDVEQRGPFSSLEERGRIMNPLRYAVLSSDFNISQTSKSNASGVQVASVNKSSQPEEIILSPMDQFYKAEALKLIDLEKAISIWEKLGSNFSVMSPGRIPGEPDVSKNNVADFLETKDPKYLALAKADALKLFYLNHDASLITRIALYTLDIKLFEDLVSKYLFFGSYKTENLKYISVEFLYAASIPEFKNILSEKLGGSVVSTFGEEYSRRKSELGQKLGEYRFDDSPYRDMVVSPCKNRNSDGVLTVGLNEFLEYTYSGQIKYSGSKCKDKFIYRRIDWTSINISASINITTGVRPVRYVDNETPLRPTSSKMEVEVTNKNNDIAVINAVCYNANELDPTRVTLTFYDSKEPSETESLKFIKL